MSISADIKENAIVHTDKVLLELLLIDRFRSTEEEVHTRMETDSVMTSYP